jgi:hypothetical protein
MATKGRGGDSLLVHMTPEEVQSLQAMALKGGGTLTINPDTGLPEANFLKKMLPMIAGAALNFFVPGLGAAVGGAFGLGAAAGTGIAVGGLATLATGSLSRGLMAGLGAYGGASLAGGLAGAGAGAAQDAAMAGLTQDQIAQQAAASGLTEQGVLNQAAADATSKYAASGFGDRLAQGATATFNDPKAFVQGMGGFGKTAQAGLAAISPMLADQGVQTTTKMPSTGTIRRFSYDPYGQTYTSQGSYPANEEERNASGGIVALAEGGVARYAAGGLTPEQFKQQMYEGGLDASAATKRGLELAAAQGLNAQQTTDLWNQALGTKFTPDDYSRVAQQYGVAGPQANVDFVKNLATDTITAADFGREVTTKGLSQQDVTAALLGSGLSGGAQFALTNQNIGDTGNVSETYGGLKGLSSNINYWLETHPGASLNTFQNEMKKWLLNEDDIKRATGKTSTELFTGPITTVYNPAEGVGGGTGAGAVGGGTVVNPNGTITTSPVIPGIPVGGFTGVQQVKDAYTTGGGSLGYANAAPTTMAEFNTRFGNQTGDSKAAYDYLMGKGANQNAYPTKTSVGDYMRPYSEAVLGVPAKAGNPTRKFIYDPTTRAYKENRDYIPVTYDNTGKRITEPSLNDIAKKAADEAKVIADAKAVADAKVIKDAADAAEAMKATVVRTTQAAIESGAPDNWDEAAYLAKYPDVGTELRTGRAIGGRGPVLYTSGYGHYLRYGKNEGWEPTYKTASKASGGLLGLARGGLMHRYAEGGTTNSAQDSVNKAQTDLQRWLATNNVSHARIAEALNIPIEEAKRRYPTTSAPSTKTGNAAYDMFTGGGGQSVAPDETISLDAVSSAIAQANIDAANAVAVSEGITAANTAAAEAVGETAPDTGGAAANSGPAAPGGGEAPSPGADAPGGGEGPGPGDAPIKKGGVIKARYAAGGISGGLGGLGALAAGGAVPQYNLGGYSDGGRLLRGPGDGVSDSIPAMIGNRQPARLADGEFVIPARIVSELGNGSTEAGARKLYAMMDRVQKARGKTTGKRRVAANTRAEKYLPA